MLKTLCKKHTNLRNEDIEKLSRIDEVLPIFSELVKADIFIDCMTRDPNMAVVVGEANPNGPSMYSHSVIGEIAYRKNEPAVLRTLETGMPSRDLKAVTQENIPVKQYVVPIKNDLEEVIGVLIMEKDVTQDLNNMKNMEILAETTEQLTQALLSKDSEKSITHYVNDGIIIFNACGVAIYANPVAEKIYEQLGYKDCIRGMTFENIALDKKSFTTIIEEKYMEDVELTIGNLSLNIKYSAIRQEGKVANVVVLLKDITEVKEKEKELILKSVAIKEIHHRVKNNLQTIASLLRLQSRRIGDEMVKKAFSESINRILSIAVTHEILAQNGVDDVDIKEILEKLLKNTLKYGTGSHLNINAQIKGDNFIINSDKASSIALVVNELLQNSLEYAFVGRNQGNIIIEIQQGRIYSSIAIEDDGVGFDIHSSRRGSLGFSIVKGIISDKLDGKFEIHSSNQGTKINFDFKNE